MSKVADGAPTLKNGPAKPAPRRAGVLFFIAVSLALVALIVLGNWQVSRLVWKEQLVSTISSRMKQPTITIDEALALWQHAGDVDYVPVRVRGIFNHQIEQHYLATHGGQSGWYVYTPLELDDGRLLVVNRGFVPYSLKEPSSRPWQPVEGIVELNGLARNPLYEKPGWVVPDNAPGDQIWYWKDFTSMSEAMALDKDRLVPFFLDAGSAHTNDDKGPIGGVTRVELPNNHLQYAVTWYGLAGALVVVAGFFVWRSYRRSD